MLIYCFLNLRVSAAIYWIVNLTLSINVFFLETNTSPHLTRENVNRNLLPAGQELKFSKWAKTADLTQVSKEMN